MERAGMLTVKPVERYDTLAERAYAQLRQALMNGTFLPGQRLTIRKLAALLEISATPAREAINRLLSERVLETDANRNVSVPVLDSARLREIYVLRIALEGEAAERGAVNMTACEIDELERTQEALVAAMDRDDYKSVLVRNGDFHFRIYEASRVGMLVQAIEQLWLKLGPSMNLLYPAYNNSRKGVSNHMLLIKALRRGDTRGVRKAMEQDLIDGVEELSNALQTVYESGKLSIGEM